MASGFRGAASLHMVRRALARHRERRFDLIVSGVAYPTGVVATTVARLARRPMVVLAFGEDVPSARPHRRPGCACRTSSRRPATS